MKKISDKICKEFAARHNCLEAHSIDEIRCVLDDAISIPELAASRDSRQLSAVPSDVDKGLGKCVEPNCGKFAQKDYNGCGHYVCDYHYDKLNREFDEEYK